ncbi:MFS transporter [Cyanobium sp. HWJ4-Hawea]|uniref:MFS transporter n=1 Tax=Cyanobium sp. HWJ4-Hawea TaxID=2823713 RepID=UPI0020CDF0F4|nr:MFS transporter [Cyanobium sp. HWJ4-Hawea]MCP9808959.1 MFS transporter [Cyanobium sp. HWJ4-Hawea]
MPWANLVEFRNRFLNHEIQADRYKWWALTIVLFSVLLLGIDSTIANLALPSITRDLNISVEASKWVIATFFVVVALALPGAGRLSDILGRKKVFIIGFLLFGLGSGLCGLAGNIEFLVAMRAIQAIGAAALFANSNVILLAVFPLRQHGLALGINGSIYSIGFALGLTLGGILISSFGWRSIFYLNVPVAVIALFLGGLVLRRDQLRTGDHDSLCTLENFDIGGFVLAAIAVGSLMIGVERLASERLPSSASVSITMLGCIAMLSLIELERSKKQPLIDVRLLLVGEFARGTFTRLLNSIILGACLFAIPFFTQIVLKFSALHSGLVMLPWSLGLATAGPISGHLSDRFGARKLTTLGFIGSGVALLWLISLGHQNISASNQILGITVMISMLLLGASSGLFIFPNTSASLDAVPQNRIGTASGLMWVMSFMGMALGTSYAAAVLRGTLEQKISSSPFLQAQDNLFTSLIILSILGALLCCTRSRSTRIKQIH